MIKKNYKLFLILLVSIFVAIPLFKMLIPPRIVEIKDEPIPLIDTFNEGQSLLNEINNVRKNHNLPILEMDDELCTYADIRSKEISENWSHTRPNGSQGYTLISSTKWRGENLAKGYNNSNDVFCGWFNSQSHLENILFENFTKAGISCYQTEDGFVYWCMLFSN